VILALGSQFTPHGTVLAQEEHRPPLIPAPDRRPNEDSGPYDTFVIRGATLIDGTGAPPREGGLETSSSLQ